MRGRNVETDVEWGGLAFFSAVAFFLALRVMECRAQDEKAGADPDGL